MRTLIAPALRLSYEPVIPLQRSTPLQRRSAVPWTLRGERGLLFLFPLFLLGAARPVEARLNARGYCDERRAHRRRALD
jgi:hypothetical protein